MQRIALVVAASTLVTACSTLFMDPLEQLREANKRNLGRVTVGHTRLEVDSIMGTDRVGGGLPEVLLGRVQYLEARNPMREEEVRGADSVDYRVVFYYTDVRTKDDKITDDELTPIVFRDGKVAGVGHAFLNRVR
jgi:hypothetical protein